MTIERVFNSTAKHGQSLTNFINMVNSAYVTFKGSEIEIDDKIYENSETRFNFSLSVSNYRVELGEAYSAAISEIEETLTNLYNKFDKQYLIISLIAEVESLISLLHKDSDNQYKHKLFQFSNISQDVKFQSQDVDESFCQEYYYWMHHYLTKSQTFLMNLKDIAEKSQQSDFQISKSMNVNVNSSTVDKPLEYFNYLFTRNGLFYLRQEFIPTEEELYYTGIEYNKETETITDNYQDSETGEWETSTKTFKDFYLNRLYNEFLLSRKLIDDNIHELHDEASITLFIKLTFSHLKYLLLAIKRYSDANKYEDSTRPVNGLIKFLEEKYAVFIPKELITKPAKELEQANEITAIPQQTLLPAPKTGMTTFKWKSEFSQPLSTLLWQNLKEDSKFIDKDTHPDDFHRAFNGSEHEQPLKILWTARSKNHQINKHLLFYLLNELSRTGLIYEDTDNVTFIKKVGFIFFDNKGNPLKNLKVSNSTAGKKRKTKLPEEEFIDVIISQLKRQAGMK